MTENYLNEIIGQEKAKMRLEIYSKSYAEDGVLPFILFTASRGGGKTKIAREFRKTLVHPDHGKPPILEVNCASIKSVDSFFFEVYDTWVDNNAILYLDECHNLPPKLQELFLTIFEKDKNLIRKVKVETSAGMEEFLFDFTKIGAMFSTTDQQKLSDPLLDRFSTVSLAPYTETQLLEIFESNCEVEVCNTIQEQIKLVFRGHPRNCVEIADNINLFSRAKEYNFINEERWFEFCSIMSIHEYGLDESEIQIIKVLGERRECSLHAIAASTGFSRSVIQRKYEHALLKKGLIEIDGKRKLTKEGKKFYEKIYE